MKLLERAKLSLGLLTGRVQPARRDFWKGAEINRFFMDWVMRPVAADEEIKGSLLKLRARARDLGRNSPVARQYLSMLAVNVVGPSGFKFQSKVRNNSGDLATKINDKIEDGWEAWSRSVSLDGRQSLTKFSQLALQSVARDGEILVRKHRIPNIPFALALELVDPDLLDEKLNLAGGEGQNEIRMGVELDQYGRRVAFHLWNRPDSPMFAGQRRRERIPADQILHLYDPDRANQTRGVTWFAPVMLPIRMLDGFVEASVIGARIGASAMGWFTRKEGVEAGALKPDERGNFEMDANPGSFNFAPDGYDISGWTPNYPNAAFPEFVKAMLRQIAAGLGCSYNALANDLEGVNFSSLRSGLFIEREVWKAKQEWFCESLLCPVFEEWLAQATLSGDLVLDSRDPRKFMAGCFQGRRWPYVDPLKERQADILAINNSLDSHSGVLAEEGKDLEDVLEQKKEDKRLAESFGVDLASPPTNITGQAGDAGGDGSDGEDTGDSADSGKKKDSKGGRLATYLNGRSPR